MVDTDVRTTRLQSSRLTSVPTVPRECSDQLLAVRSASSSSLHITRPSNRTVRKSLVSDPLPVKRRTLRGILSDVIARLSRGSSNDDAQDGSKLISSGVTSEEERVLADNFRRYQLDREAQALKEVTSFLPICIRDKELSADTVIVHRFEGAVVFSDASGFTALTEQLAKKPNGAEILSACLNKFFTPLIAIITSFRGDVIKFSGDALTITFEAFDESDLHDFPCGTMDCPHTPLGLACMRAVACCLEIHKRLHNFETGAGDVRLTLHIGVGAGHLTMLQVGGSYGRYEYVIAGPPLEQIAIAEPLAGSGETVLSPSVWEIVDPYFSRGEPLGPDAPPGFARLGDIRKTWHTYPSIKRAAENAQEYNAAKQAEKDPKSEERLFERSKRFVPRAVLQHFLSGAGSNVNEMRRVSIIFVQINGIKVYTDEGVPITAQLMKVMQLATYCTEGSLNKFLVDDKGLLFLLVFGLSPLVHIDDPVRAVRTCFQMIESLTEMKLEARFGVTTGRVFCGVVGSASRREYTVMGDTVNLSARLMAHADNLTVLIDNSTYERIKDTIKCEQLIPIRVKGKADLIPVYRPLPPQYVSNTADVDLKYRARLHRSSWGLDTTLVGNHQSCLFWRAKTHVFGGQGKSLLGKVRRWKMHKVIDRFDIREARYIFITGQTGSGKVEFCELMIHKCLQAGWAFACSTTECFHDEPHRHLTEIVTSLFHCVETHTNTTIPEWIFEYPVDRQLLAVFGLAKDNCAAENHLMSDSHVRLLETATHDLVGRLVTRVTRVIPLLITLREISGNTLLPASTETFWNLARFLIRMFGRVEANARGAKNVHPVLIQVVTRKIGKRCDSLARANFDVRMEPLTLSSARELMWLGLNKELRPNAVYNDETLPKKFLNFLHGLSLNIPDYIQEMVERLLAEGIVEVTPAGECVIKSDLRKVDIAEWVGTKMVGGVQSKIESLGPLKLQVLKLATIFQGPFSAFDLIGAPFHREDDSRRGGALVDQVKMILACEQMVQQDLLVRFEYRGKCHDMAPRSTPRWTVANFLVRTVAKAMVLYSHYLLIKRSTLMHRALRVQLPKRLLQKQRERLRLTEEDVPEEEEKKEAASEVSDATDESHDEDNFNFGMWGDEGEDDEDIDSDESDTDRQLLMAKRERLSEFTHKEADASLYVGTELTTPVLSPDREEHQQRYSAARSARHSRASFTSCSIDSNDAKMNENNVSPLNRELLEACAEGELMRADFILGRRADPMAIDSNGISAIHFASMSGSLECVRLLLMFSADLSVKTKRGQIPLVLAAQYAHQRTVLYMVDTLNALMTSGGRSSARDAGMDLLEPSFWEARLPPIRNLRDVPKHMHPAYMLNDPETENEFAHLRRKARDIFRKHLGGHDRHKSQHNQSKSSPLQKSIDLHDKGLHSSELPVTLQRLSSSSTIEDGCQQCRRKRRIDFMRGRFGTTVMAIALFVALYLPDMWVLGHVSTSLPLDIILTFVMALFTVECLTLLHCDVRYRWSFFFWMDVIGTVSIIFDVSYFVMGERADELMDAVNVGDGSDDSAVVARTARTAKLAARAGRITRLVKLLRFLPGVELDVDKTPGQKTATVTSALLGNLLSKGVALLTILLVSVIPVFGLGSYPEVDRSLSRWMVSLAQNFEHYQNGQVELEFLQRNFRDFGTFYDSQPYFPFQVCIGGNSSGTFVCNSTYDHIVAPFYASRGPMIGAPSRKASQMTLVNVGDTPTVQGSFNFFKADDRESIGSVVLMSCTIMLMCGITLLLSHSVTFVAIAPIERMLDGIRKSAKRICSTVDMALQEKDDVDQNKEENEMLLLEAIVKKITKLSELVGKKNPWGDDLTQMQTEDRGILALADVSQEEQDTGGDSVKGWKGKLEDSKMLESRESIARMALQSMYLTWERLDSWDCTVVETSVATQKALGAWLLLNHQGLKGLGRAASSEVVINSFIEKVMSEYSWNSYHSWTHAIDVVHCVSRIFTLTDKSCNFVEPIYQYALLVSAICHDIGHPGLNNHFLVETGDQLALRYNDKSPLENMHCCKLFEIAIVPKYSVFANFTRNEYKEIRKVCIATILHTDMAKHFQMIKDISIVYQLNSELISKSTFNRDTFEAPAIAQLIVKPNHMLFLCLVLHMADLSNSCKPWKICQAWSLRIMDEFFLQGDQERQLGLPVQILNDRKTVVKPNAQLGFIEFIMVPFLAPTLQVLPMLYEFGVHLKINIKQWHKLWLQTKKIMKSEDEKKKIIGMEERVKKSIKLIDDAMNTWKEVDIGKKNTR
eukprot:GEMP01000338.1.p1 GENE.GEMP01000338.1~~GEMP01000338.1.p1  ORF type:complete len:2269 (+),score=428.96 GEMP01000338.1:104-6910(+)